MSEQNPNQPEPNQPEPDEVEQTDDVVALRSEAANRRRALRATEAERDALRARLDERDRQDVERMATDRLADPGDLWLSTSLDAMRADDGTIDMEKADAELQRVLSEKPHWRTPEPVALPDLHGGATRGVPEPPAPPSFGETVKKAVGRR